MLRVARPTSFLPISQLRACIHTGKRSKQVSLEEAVALIRNNDHITISGFGSQGCPNALLAGIEKRFLTEGNPKNLTVIFEGGPGDYGKRGINHLAHKGLMLRAVGSHYAQAQHLANTLVLPNEIEGYALPMGAISRMLRAKASLTPAYLTKIGTGTFVDPEFGTGGRLNERTKEQLVQVVTLNGERYLSFQALKVDVALIRGTTSDLSGNISFEHESFTTDARLMAAAAKASGGLVIAQVKRLSTHVPSRSVVVPEILVDAVYEVPTNDLQEHHGQSFFSFHNPSWTGEVIAPMSNTETMPYGIRKMVARRAAQELRPNQTVNLGIGMPEGIALVAKEEDVFNYLTSTTEAGTIGGAGTAHHEFGAAMNAKAYMEHNQLFDFYNSGGLDIAFLGLGQVNSNGDLNVSRLSKKRLAGPGGFLDIAHSTPKLVFMGAFTNGDLEVDFNEQSGELKIIKEGNQKKFVNNLVEVSFCGDQALQRGQQVFFVTERCVLKRTEHGVELIEVAPGIDIERDILGQMEWAPIIRGTPKIMKKEIFKKALMGLKNQFAISPSGVADRLSFNPKTNTVFVDFSGLVLNNVDDVAVVEATLTDFLQKHDTAPLMIVNYTHFDCHSSAQLAYTQAIKSISERYARVLRYSAKPFARLLVANELEILSPMHLWQRFDLDNDGFVSFTEVRNVLRDLGMQVDQDILESTMKSLAVAVDQHKLSHQGFSELCKLFWSRRLNN